MAPARLVTVLPWPRVASGHRSSRRGASAQPDCRIGVRVRSAFRWLRFETSLRTARAVLR